MGVLPNLMIPSVSACPGSGANGPLAAFTYEQGCGGCLVVGFPILLNASWSVSPTGAIVLYTWNFGDGSPQVQTTSPSTRHGYGSLGPNNAGWQTTLTVRDSNGLNDTITQTVTPDAIPRFTFQPSSPFTNQSVTFDASASQVYTTFNTTVTYSWNLGDGTMISGATVNHSFSTASIYRVALTFFNVYGTSQVSKTVRVILDPPATSSRSGGSGRAPLHV